MNLYKTQDIAKIGCYSVVTPGIDIYAEDIQHFNLALIHHGKSSMKVKLVEVTELHCSNVQDSLLTPSKLQLN